MGSGRQAAQGSVVGFPVGLVGRRPR